MATGDPNPAAGGGAERLRASGVAVERGLCEAEALGQNAIFLHQWRVTDRPFVALKLATTLDGHIADDQGRSRWISGDEARDYVHWLRAGYDAIGVGGHTARVDDASLTVRGELVPRRIPRRVIFSRHGELPASLTLVQTAAEIPTTVITEAHGPSSRLAHLEDAGVEILRVGSLQQGLEQLRASGVGSLLVEGGGRLAGALLEAGLVDRYYWVQSPLWLGATGTPAIAGLPGTTLIEAERWTVVERRALGQDTLLVVDRECSPAS